MLPNYVVMKTLLIVSLLLHLSHCLLVRSFSPSKNPHILFLKEISVLTSLFFVYNIFFSAFSSFLRRTLSYFGVSNYLRWTLARMSILFSSSLNWPTGLIQSLSRYVRLLSCHRMQFSFKGLLPSASLSGNGFRHFQLFQLFLTVFYCFQLFSTVSNRLQPFSTVFNCFHSF